MHWLTQVVIAIGAAFRIQRVDIRKDVCGIKTKIHTRQPLEEPGSVLCFCYKRKLVRLLPL